MKWTNHQDLKKLKEACKPKKKKAKTNVKKVKTIFVKKTFPNYKAYLMSKDWERLRNQKLSAVGSTCQICNSPDNLHIHHRTYKRIYNERLNDLTVLCGSCHLLFHQQHWTEEKIEAEVYKLMEKDLTFFLRK